LNPCDLVLKSLKYFTLYFLILLYFMTPRDQNVTASAGSLSDPKGAKTEHGRRNNRPDARRDGYSGAAARSMEGEEAGLYFLK
jgi:hypothetical protein